MFLNKIFELINLFSNRTTGQDRQKILKENTILKRQNEQIIAENSELKKRLIEIETKLTAMNTSIKQSLPVQINASSNLSSPSKNQSMNNQVNQESNKLRSNFSSSSIQSAELIKEFQQKILDAELNADQKMSNSKMSKKIHQTIRNKELIILIKQLISLFMIMKMKNYYHGSKTVTKIYLNKILQQTLKKLMKFLTKQQMKILISNVINRKLKSMDLMNSIQPGTHKTSLYQKLI